MRRPWPLRGLLGERQRESDRKEKKEKSRKTKEETLRLNLSTTPDLKF